MLEVSSPSTNTRAFADPRKAKKEVQSLDMRSSELSDTRALIDPSRSRYDCDVIESTPNEAEPEMTSKGSALDDTSSSCEDSLRGKCAAGSGSSEKNDIS